MQGSSCEVTNYIEACLYWRKPFTRNGLEQRFNITKPTALKKLKPFEDAQQLMVSKLGKANLYRAGKHYAPSQPAPSFNQFVANHPVVEGGVATPLNYQRSEAPEIIGELLFAIETNYKFEASYFSVSSGEHEHRVIQPHSIVFASGRYHVRAYCEKSKRFSDFVLARFANEGMVGFEGLPEQAIEQDQDWNTELTLTIIADPRLPANNRKGVELEYGMKNGKLELTTRKALVNYALQELRIDRYHEDPKAQQIILEPRCRECVTARQ